MARRLLLAALVGLGVAIAVAWGFRALLVYLVFVAVAAGLAYAAAVGGDWVTDASRARYERRDDERDR